MVGLLVAGVSALFRENLECVSVPAEPSTTYHNTCGDYFDAFLDWQKAFVETLPEDTTITAEPYAVDTNLDVDAADAQVLSDILAFTGHVEDPSQGCIIARQRLACLLAFPRCVREGAFYPLFPCKDVCVAYMDACDESRSKDACETFPDTDCVPNDQVQVDVSAADQRSAGVRQALLAAAFVLALTLL